MIDFHTHCYPEFLAPRALGQARYDWDFQSDATVNGQLRIMRQKKVDKALTLHVANRPSEVRNVNRFAKHVMDDSENLESFGVIHPYMEGVMEELEWIQEQGMVGVKLHPIRQEFSLQDPICKPIFERIGEMGLVTLIHCGRTRRSPNYWVMPEDVRACIDWFRGGTVVCAHMGGMFLSNEEALSMADLPIMVDTAFSSLHLTQGEFNIRLEAFGAERVLFGTDLPWADFDRELAFVDQAELTEVERSLILEGNALKLLGKEKLPV